MSSGRSPGRPVGTGVFDDDELLDRALSMLARGGYRALTMRGLARELGVSLASVQHRYATKDRLWRAAVDRAMGDVEVVDAGADALPDVLRRRIDASARHPGLLFALLADDAPGAEQRLGYIGDRLRPPLDSARAVLADAAGAGLTRAVDAEVLVAMMMVGIGSLGSLSSAVADLLGLGDDPHERLAAGLADLLLFGVVTRD